MSDQPSERSVQPIPACAGIGLRSAHHREVVDTRPALGWFEVHSENYFGDGGLPLFYLEQIRKDYPLSLHGVGLSIASTDELNWQHLAKLKSLIERFQPGLVSEHLCWSSVGHIYTNDLLPLPYTEEALTHTCNRIAQVQDYLGRQILIENVSSYLRYRHSTITEWEFLAAIADLSGCGILLDVNNIYVSATNHRFDPYCYLHAIPISSVQEIHLAGFAINHYQQGGVLIDNHGARVAQPVWELYRHAVQRFGVLPTLIEWDTDIPPLAVLLDEARKADSVLEAHRDLVA